MTAEIKQCANCKIDFEIGTADFAFYDMIHVPAPTWCPWCRMVRRMAFFNERSFFKRREAGKVILSTFPEDSYVKVIDKDIWWSDNFDPTIYGQDYDFSRPFFEQLKELYGKVPLPHRSGTDLMNSDYSNNANNLKNCYMVFNSANCEDCFYITFCGRVKGSMDIANGSDMEGCYGIDTGDKCNRVFLGRNVDNSLDCRLMYDCDSCTDCFGCVNQKRKHYCIFNQEYSKEDYEKYLAEMNIGSYSAMQEYKKRVAELRLSVPHKYYNGMKNVDTVGENVCHSKSALYCYTGHDLEFVAHSQSVTSKVKDCYDYTNWGYAAELVYEAVDSGIHLNRVKFSYGCTESMNIDYCFVSMDIKDCFGCIGMRKKQYCILNKQYSKEEYEVMVPKIIQHMKDMPYRDSLGRTYAYGEFFPPEMSPFSANETALFDLDGGIIDKAAAESYGLIWREPKANEYKITIKALDLPDNIADTPDTIANEIIECAECQKAYRITAKEFNFFRQNTIPLPRLCHNCRYKEWISLRNPHKWYKAKCQCNGSQSANGIYQNTAQHEHGTESCSFEFETTYAPDRKEIIYCEKCYNLEVS